MWQMPREEWRLLCGPTERRRNPHTSSASLSLCPTSETESRCSNLLYWTPEKFHLTVGVLRIFSEEEEVCVPTIILLFILYIHLYRRRQKQW
jgi:hypothetical protein